MRGSYNAVTGSAAIAGLAVAAMSFFLLVGPPMPASAADVCKDWGSPSFYCPTTATRDVCGNAPNFYCFASGDPNGDICTGATPAPRYTFRCNTCTCQCDTVNYPCAGCTATSVTPGAACSPPINGKYATGCPESCACPSDTTLCVSTNTCVTNLVCPDGTTFNPCTNSCETPYILRSPATRQANASILIDGSADLATHLKVGTDLYMNDGKAIRADKNGSSALNMGNGYGSWGAQPFELNVYGQVSTAETGNPVMSRMGIANLDPGYRLDIWNGGDTQSIVSITDKDTAPTFTGTRLARGLLEKWFSGMTAGSNDFVIYRNGDFATPRILIDHGSGNVGIGTTSPSATLSVGNAGSSLFTVAGATGSALTQGDLTVNGNTTLGDGSTDTVTILGRLGDTVLGAGKLFTYGTAAADPVAGMVEGSMYYNTTDGKFRCYQRFPIGTLGWTDCYADNALQGAAANKQVAFFIGANKLNGSNSFMFDYDTNVLSLNGKMVLGVLGAADSYTALCRNSANEIATCQPLTDAQISDDLTAKYFVGTGSTTNAVDLATNEVAGVLGAANGGTGFSSYTVGDILYASGASTLSKLSDVAVGSVLISGGVGVAPSWGKITLGTHTVGAYDATPDTIADDNSINLTGEVGGILPLANGGTNNSGLSTYPNQVVIINATGTQLVQSGRTISDLQSASQINSGTLAVARGGTGLSTTPAAGQLLIGNGTGYTLNTLTAGSNISISNAAGSVTISALSNWPPGAAGQTLRHNGTAWTATSDITMDGTGRVDLSGGGSSGCTVFADGSFSCGGGITASDNDQISGGPFYMVPIGAISGWNGRMYYDSGLNKFRCYENSAWKDCIPTVPSVSGSTNYVAKFTGASSVGNSQIYDNGSNVGIGTSSPSYKLHVAGAIYSVSGSDFFTSTPGTGNGIRVNGLNTGINASGGTYGIVATSSNRAIDASTDGGIGAVAVYGKATGTGIGVKGESTYWLGYPAVQGIGTGYARGVQGISVSGDGVEGESTSGTAVRGISSSGYGGDFETSTGIALHAKATGNTKAARFDGTVGIYAEPGGAYALYISGSAYATGSWAGSDVRLKKSISIISGALDDIRQLRGVNFEWRSSEYPDRHLEEGRQMGLIAQEVEPVLPELVKTDVDGFKAVSYEKLTAVLVEAIKELDKLAIKLAPDGTVAVPGDFQAETNKWGSASGWISCPETGECSCPNGYFMTSLKDRGALIQCHKL